MKKNNKTKSSGTDHSSICHSESKASVYLGIQRLKLANAMEKIFGSNDMPEDLAGDNSTSKHEAMSI